MSRNVLCSSTAAVLGVVLMTRPAHASVDCSYVGTGCNEGYAATATFTCTSPSLLKIVVTNTSSINAASTSNNILSSLTFTGASPVASTSDSATVAAGSSVVGSPPYTDCSGVADGPDVTCEWSAGSDYCPDSANDCRGTDASCLSTTNQCGLGFVGSRESADVSCDNTNNFQLDPTKDIDGSPDGPDWGLINSPTQTVGGNEAIDDTIVAILDVGTCVESPDLCIGAATFGSHYRHADWVTSTTTTTSTTTIPPTTTTGSTTSTTQATTTSTTESTTSTTQATTTSTTESTTSTTQATTTSTTESTTSTTGATTSTTEATTTTTVTTTTTITLPGPPLGHYQCSEIKPFNFAPIPGVNVVDRLQTATLMLTRPAQVCAPADKNGEDPTAPADPQHLTAYRVSAPPFERVRGVRVTNQLGTLLLDLKRPDFLLVPSAKSLVGAPPPLSPTVDHFLCYKVGRSRGGPKFVKILGIPVEDQFGPFKANLLKPKRLCAPANKNGENPGAENHPDYLLCYKARQLSPLGTIGAFLRDQFGLLSLTLTRRQELCVPSEIGLPSGAFLEAPGGGN